MFFFQRNDIVNIWLKWTMALEILRHRSHKPSGWLVQIVINENIIFG